MTVNYVSKPLLCRELIGREQELADLQAALERARQRQSQFLLVHGSAGLGKTRLLRAVLETAQAADISTLVGQASQVEGALPFGLFLDAFRRHFTHLARRQAALPAASSSALPQLLRVLPELTSLYPDVTPTKIDTSGTPLQQQQRLFAQVLNGLRALIADTGQPLVLVLEDLHWADETSLELLNFLVRQLEVNPADPNTKGEPILIIGTYRTEALSDSPTLARWLVSWNNQRQLHQIELKPLGRTAHAAMLKAILGQPLSEAFAAMLFERDEGNPFFTEELLGALVADGYLQEQEGSWREQGGFVLNLPLSLRASILERVASLGPNSQEVLAMAATIGREFDFELLAGISGLNERDLLAILRQAIDAQIVGEVGSQPYGDDGETERYQFRHALTREAIYGDMLGRERKMRHRAVAEALEKQLEGQPGEPGQASRLLAEHYWLAGLPKRAKPHALHEAERARQVLAFREERHYLQIALAALDETAPEGLEMLERVGLVSLAIGDIRAALDYLNRAKNGYQNLQQSRRATIILVHQTFLAWMYEPARHPLLLEELQRSAATIFNDPAAQDLNALMIYSQTAFSLASSDWHKAAAVWVERSFALAEKLDNPMKAGALLLSQLALGVQHTDTDQPSLEEGLAQISQVLEFTLQYSLPDLALLSYSMLFMALSEWGLSERADKLMTELTQYEERSGSSRMTNLRHWQNFLSGDWNTAVSELEAAISQPNAPTPDALNRVVLAHLYIARHELDAAQKHLDMALPQLRPLQFTYAAQALWAYAKLEAACADLPAAQNLFEEILMLWKTTDDRSAIIPILLDGLKFYAAQGHPLKSGQWLAELKQLADHTANAVAIAAQSEGEGWQNLAEGDPTGAIIQWRSAVEAWAKLKRPYQQASLSEKLAATLLASSDKSKAARAEAEQLLDTAAQIYERLGVSLASVEAVRSLHRVGMQSKRRATLEANRRPFKDLTRREVQVLIQISAGLTNKEIAASLQISPGTVELHVNHILSKLECDSRTQAAAYAIEQGWVKSGLSS